MKNIKLSTIIMLEYVDHKEYNKVQRRINNILKKYNISLRIYDAK